jgi:iron complex outermembrane recepter protein
MKRKNPVALLFGWLALSLAPQPCANAAAPGATSAPSAGSITGRVQNVVTGQYLNNARVSVQGTQLMAFTDESGTYRLVGVPHGTVVLEVFYTGLDEHKSTVVVAPNQVVERDVTLTNVQRYGSGNDIVKLGAYTVAAERETDIEAIAINEQRFASNIKNVISTESIGDPLGGSAGDFLRYLPGVSGAYGALETDGVLIRGFPSNMSVVTSDGVQLANVDAGGNRDFPPSRITANGFSRVEVAKVPLPSTPADTVSGSINLISKKAFERSRREFRYSMGLSSNDSRLSLGKQAWPDNTKRTGIFPEANFDYTLPINKNLGVVFTGLASRTAFETDSRSTDYTAVAAGTGATQENPYVYRYQNNEVSREATRRSFSGQADWRITTHGVLSAGASISYYRFYNHNAGFFPTAGTIATPSIPNGIPLTYTPDEVIGATGRGAVTMQYNYSSNLTLGKAGYIRYGYNNGLWKFDTSINRSISRARARSTDAGFFSTVNVSTKMPVRVTFRGIRDGKIDSVQVFDNDNQEIDPLDINNYQVTGATGNAVRRSTMGITTLELSGKRQLMLFGVPGAIQTGASWRDQLADKNTIDRQIIPSYSGVNGDRSAAPFVGEHWYGARKLELETWPGNSYVPWVSPYKTWQIYQQSPNLFTETVANQRTGIVGAITNSTNIRETVSAAYVQGEARLFRNRLNVVTGVRFERTVDDGVGPLQDVDAPFVRNANGSFALTPTGARIRKPEAGSAGSLEEVALIYKLRGAHAKRSYQGYYPSLHLTYDVNNKLVARAAYAETYGRPNFSNILPNTTVVEDVGAGGEAGNGITTGRITAANTGLRPWSAHNYDLSLEYYTESGGLLSGGVFLKEVSDFFGSSVRLATAQDLEQVGLDSRYIGWQLTSTFNSGSAKVKGVEFNVRQSLAPLASWAKNISVFANVTKLQLVGNRFSDFSGFLPKSASWGATVGLGRFTFITKWNYRGEQKRVAYPTGGTDAFLFPQPRLQLDVNANCRISKNTLLYLNVRNATNFLQEEYAYGPLTPAYAKNQYSGVYGRMITIGVKGSF